MGTAVFVAAALPSVAADRAPADSMLDRARTAVATHEFAGTVRIRWRTETGLAQQDVPVRAVDGGLQLANGHLVEDDGRAWMRNDARWQTLWSDTRAPAAPSVASKYHVRIAPGPVVAGHPTRALTIRRSGHVVERYAFDRTNGLVLQRIRYGDGGRVSASMMFVELGPVRTVQGRLATPKVEAGAPRPLARPPSDAHRRVGNGFVLVGARSASGTRPSCSTATACSPRRCSPATAPSTGTRCRPATGSGSETPRPGATALRVAPCWPGRSGGRTYTCVTDASDSEQRAVMASLSHTDDGAWTDAVRFVTSPFSWF